MGVIIFCAIVALYYVPTIVAFNRTAKDKVSIIVLNVFLGWTLVGWVVALMMAVRDER